MEFSGVYINYHHLSLLCDRMTCSKNMVPIYRSGLLNDNEGLFNNDLVDIGIGRFPVSTI